MKRLFIIFGILICFIARADTETINWYVDGNAYATTTCQTGGDIILPNTPYKYGYTFQGWLAYMPIEYLESTGTQWIDTGITPNLDTKIKLAVSASNISRNGISGDYWRGHTTLLMFEYSKIKWHFCGDNISNIYSGEVGSNTITNIEAENGKLIVNDLVYTCARLNDLVYNSSKIFLFANIPGEWSEPGIIKMYYFQIYDNEILIRDMIPVLDYNGIPCMYDKISQQFFYNQGTGNFIAGPVIGGQ